MHSESEVNLPRGIKKIKQMMRTVMSVCSAIAPALCSAAMPALRPTTCAALEKMAGACHQGNGCALNALWGEEVRHCSAQ